MMYTLQRGENVAQFNTLADVLVILNARNHSEADAAAMASNQITLFKNDISLSMVRNSHGSYGVIQPGTGKDVFTAMFDEVTTHYLCPDGNVRQPWQMLREEWLAAHAVGSAAYNVYPCFTAGQQRETYEYADRNGVIQQTDLSGYCRHLFWQRCGYGHNGPPYGPQRDSNSRHEVHVAYALAENKPVPNAVIQQYMGIAKNVGNFDVGDWFDALLRIPALRGAIPVVKFASLVSVLRRDKITLTVDNAQSFITLMRELPGDSPTMVKIEDFLYARGVLSPLPTKELPPVDIGKANSPLAIKLRDNLGEWQKLKALNKAQDELYDGRMSKREFERDVELALQMPARESFRRGNFVATAIEEKNIEVMLQIFDSAEVDNVVTKRTVFAETGLKTFGVKAAARRDAVFKYCGYDANMRATYEQSVKDKAAAAKAARLVAKTALDEVTTQPSDPAQAENRRSTLTA